MPSVAGDMPPAGSQWNVAAAVATVPAKRPNCFELWIALSASPSAAPARNCPAAGEGSLLLSYSLSSRSSG
jgi:hypothetical protein